MSTDSPASLNNYWQSLATPTVTLDDPLLQCLVLLTKLHQHPLTADALTAGLPLVNHRLTPELFIRAAQRANLATRLLKHSLTRFTELSLPAVLLLKDGHACVLLKYTQKRKKTLQVILPDTGEGVTEISLTDLQSNYSGYALFARPVYAFDTRTEDSAMPRPWFWFWGVVFKSWPLYIEVLIASLLINLFALASPLFVMNVYDRVVPNQAIETLWVLATGVAIIFGFDFFMRNLRGYFLDMAGKKADILLSSRLFEQVLGTQRVAQPRSVGAFANHLHEFETFRDFFTSATLTTLIDLPFAVFFIFVIWTIHHDLAQVPVLAIPIVIGFSFLLQFPLRRLIQHSFRAGAQKQALLVEALTGMEDLKALRAEGLWQRRWEQLMGEVTTSSLKIRLLSALTVNFSLFVQQVTTVAIVVYGVYFIADNQLTTGGLVACTILAGRALAPLTGVATLFTRYHQSVAALRALNQIMQMPLERPLKQTFLQRSMLHGDIEFKQVDFTYPDQPLPSLQKVSFHISAGQRVGVIGRIGSGKSTIAKLILGFYPPHNGSILLDGVDSRQLDPAELRRHIGYVPQDSLLFYGTVKENITLGAPYVEDHQVLWAAKLAGVDEFVNRHPLGFEMPIGERGEGLSGGQRQAIVLARTLLLNPTILLFDEPTHSLDNRSEEQFKMRLQPYLEGKTLILVTHRMSLLSLVDRLIVIDNGQVVAQGPKEQVISALSSGQIKMAN